MKWRAFTYQNIVYDLSHLYSFSWTYVFPAQGVDLERNYPFDVTFGLHTFTKGITDSVSGDQGLIYGDSREERQFDFDRYELSKRLPEVVRSLGIRKCYQTRHGNFFTVDLIKEDGMERNYEVYFAVSRSNKQKGRLRLYIQSAYERTENHGAQPGKKPRIGFHVIAHNKLNNKSIKAPK